MSDLRQAAQQALEALMKSHTHPLLPDDCEEAITALRAALAEPEQNPFGDDAERYARKLHEERESYKALFTEHKPQTTHWEGCEAVHPECRKPEQEPVAWLYRDAWGTMKLSQTLPPPVGAFPVYTAPTPRKPLTDYINAAGINGGDSPHMVVEKLQSAIERAHGIGGQHGS